MRKYLTWRMLVSVRSRSVRNASLRLSTCCNATTESAGSCAWASWSSRKVSGARTVRVNGCATVRQRGVGGQGACSPTERCCGGGGIAVWFCLEYIVECFEECRDERERDGSAQQTGGHSFVARADGEDGNMRRRRIKSECVVKQCEDPCRTVSTGVRDVYGERGG